MSRSFGKIRYKYLLFKIKQTKSEARSSQLVDYRHFKCSPPTILAGRSLRKCLNTSTLTKTPSSEEKARSHHLTPNRGKSQKNLVTL